MSRNHRVALLISAKHALKKTRDYIICPQYKKNHPKIAPDVREVLSDMYSFGRIILSTINSIKLTIPGLSSLMDRCLEYSMEKRPKTNEFLKKLFFNIISIH